MASADRSHQHTRKDTNAKNANANAGGDGQHVHAAAAAGFRSFARPSADPTHSPIRIPIPIAQATSESVQPHFHHRSDDRIGEGPLANLHHPPSLSTHRRAKSESQQRSPVANTANCATFASPPALLQPEKDRTQQRAKESFVIQKPITILSTTKSSQPPAQKVTRSKPIPIATTHRQPTHTGLTPLSGRPPSNFAPDYFFPVRSRTPSPSPSSQRHSSTPVSPRSPDKDSYKMSSRPSQSSPLSPAAPTQPMRIPPPSAEEGTPKNRSQSHPRPAAPSLNLAGLPKYHPANFPTSGDNTPLSPRSIQALNSSKRNTRRGSDAQHALHKYQRETVSRASVFSELAKPTSPRLIPEGSPAAPITPLALEAQSDYFRTRPNVPANTADARRMVDEMLQKENEQRGHPGGRRPGSVSPAITPPV